MGHPKKARGLRISTSSRHVCPHCIVECEARLVDPPRLLLKIEGGGRAEQGHMLRVLLQARGQNFFCTIEVSCSERGLVPFECLFWTGTATEGNEPHQNSPGDPNLSPQPRPF